MKSEQFTQTQLAMKGLKKHPFAIWNKGRKVQMVVWSNDPKETIRKGLMKYFDKVEL